MLRMKYLVTLTLVALLMASSAAFAGPWVSLEYVTPLTTTSVPVATDFTTDPFDDVDSEYWAWAHIEECVATHTEAEDFIVQGFGYDVYQPGWEVTRGSMAVFVARAAAYTDEVSGMSFPIDVPDSYWAYEEIEQCVFNGVVQGYADYYGEDVDAYLPANIVDRGQMAVYLYRAAGLSTAAYQGLFEDVDDEFWAVLEIEACADADIAQGYGTGIGYLPNKNVTRAQMAVFVWRALVRGDADVVLAGPAVTDDTAWIPGNGIAALFFPDDMAGATGCVTIKNGACTMADTGDLVTSTAHGLLVGDTITFGTDVGGVDPDEDYYVDTVPSADTFTVSDDDGDTTFEITADGDNTWSGPALAVEPGAVVFLVFDAAQIGDGDVDFEVTYVKNGACTMADTGELVTSTAHGLTVGDTITFGDDVGGVDPDEDYYVLTVPTADTFTVSDDEGVTTFDITEDGDNTWTDTGPTVAGGDSVTVVPGTLPGPAAGTAKWAVNDTGGVPYLLASYQIDSALTAEDYTLTITLPNLNVQTMDFTVE